MTRAKFEALAEQHGIEVEYRPGGTISRGPMMGEKYAAEIMLDAPFKKLFRTSSCHCDGSLNHTLEEDGTRTDWKGSYEGLKKIIDYGFDDCEDPDCEICITEESEL